ncbi:MAG: hypothetical protein GY862_08755 [Gammaproteobacteria bacterium]|nr:hypothetical protein [Gammaproteobacteria bacterium]
MSSTLRGLANTYFQGKLDRETYLTERTDLIDRITESQPTIRRPRRGSTEASAPPVQGQADVVETKKLPHQEAAPKSMPMVIFALVIIVSAFAGGGFFYKDNIVRFFHELTGEAGEQHDPGQETAPVLESGGGQTDKNTSSEQVADTEPAAVEGANQNEAGAFPETPSAEKVRTGDPKEAKTSDETPAGTPLDEGTKAPETPRPDGKEAAPSENAPVPPAETGAVVQVPPVEKPGSPADKPKQPDKENDKSENGTSGKNSLPAQAAPKNTGAGKDAKIEKKLKQCRRHDKDKRWTDTVTKKGTAVPCFYAVLQMDRNNDEARAGLIKIARKYLEKGKKALDESEVQLKKVDNYQTKIENAGLGEMKKLFKSAKGKLKKTKVYLKRIEKVNPDDPILAELKPRWENYKEKVQEQTRRWNMMKRLKECQGHFDEDRITTTVVASKKTAQGCYEEILAQAPGNTGATAGMERIKFYYQKQVEEACRENRFKDLAKYLEPIKKIKAFAPGSQFLAKHEECLKNSAGRGFSAGRGL